MTFPFPFPRQIWRSRDSSCIRIPSLSFAAERSAFAMSFCLSISFCSASSRALREGQRLLFTSRLLRYNAWNSVGGKVQDRKSCFSWELRMFWKFIPNPDSESASSLACNQPSDYSVRWSKSLTLPYSMGFPYQSYRRFMRHSSQNVLFHIKNTHTFWVRGAPWEWGERTLCIYIA